MTATVRQLAVGVALLACCAGAHAHAFLDRARPAVGSTVHGSPAEVTLSFTTPVEPAFSTVKVLNQSGTQVDRKDKQVDADNPTRMKVTLPPLANGTYRVVWHVLSVDTHVTDGEFTFEVAP